MSIQVEAIYENGVLRPLQALDLTEHERVVVSVARTDPTGGPSRAVEFVENLRRELKDAGPAPGVDAVRLRLASIPGSLTDDFIAERDDRRSK